MTTRGWLSLSLATLVLSLAGVAAAQDTTGNGGTGTGGTGENAGGTGSPTSSEVALHDEQANMEDGHSGHTVGQTVHHDDTDPYEDPHQSYYFVGAFYRHFIAPTYALNFFVDGGKVIDEPGGGAFFTYRKDGLSISAQVWGQSAAFQGIFRESGATVNETEWWNSSWGVVWAAASFLWSTPFNDMFAIEYGFDIGVGFVFNSAYRTEAYAPPGVGANDYQRWQPCTAPGMPSAPTDSMMTCNGPAVPDGVRGEQYNAKIRNWADGGGVPIVVPWLGVPHIALRFKPIKQIEIRLDAGAFAGILAFYMGASLAYGFQ